MTWNTGTPPVWYRRAKWNAPWSKRNGVHYVGDDVIIDLTWVTDDATVSHKRTIGFEFGEDGQTIAVTDREMQTPFGSVTGSPTYSSTHARDDLSMRINGANQFLTLTTANGDQHGRLYLYATQNPSSTVWIVRTQSPGLFILPTGELQVNSETPFTTPIALNQWVRIEFRFKFDAVQANTISEAKLYNDGDSQTPTEVQTFPNTLGSSNSFYSYGACDANAWGANIWIDDIVSGASSYQGPSGPLWGQQPGNTIDYVVRDYYGNIVSSGSFEESSTWFRPAPPGRGWRPGWYRVYLSGPQTDTNFYSSYGATNVCVVKSDSHLVSMPAGDVVGGYNGEYPDLVMKGVMGLGTSRLIIWDAANPAADIAAAEQELALTKTYWTATGTPDTERTTREPWCTFPNCDGSTTQLAGVTSVVAALYPDCKYYEGPMNEPARDASTATKMQEFAAAVHAGNANAKAIGPSFVETWGWEPFLDAGGGAHCDEISFHAYNDVTNGDLNLGRNTISALTNTLASYGLSAKPLWQTESTGPRGVIYGVYHPRKARWTMLETLLWEQSGVPRERNNWWYDISHGFFDAPSWIEHGDGSLEPSAVLGRVLAEETWGRPYSSALDFGTLGNAMFIGNVYEGTSGKTVALMATSYMTGASIALTITGAAGPFTVVDGFGNERVMPLSKGRVTIPMTDIPMYVRLPTSATATVYRVNGHSPLGAGASVSPDATTKQIDGVTYDVIADNEFHQTYVGSGTAPPSESPVPGDVTLIWPTDKTIERVIVWGGAGAWQHDGVLIDFDVQTYDGATWTTRKTITKPSPPWFDHGTDTTNTACFQETFWDEQWIFDVELDAAVSCQGVRLNIREASYGGEPLSTDVIANGAGGGQGTPAQGYRLQEIAVVDANRYAGAA